MHGWFGNVLVEQYYYFSQFSLPLNIFFAVAINVLSRRFMISISISRFSYCIIGYMTNYFGNQEDHKKPDAFKIHKKQIVGQARCILCDVQSMTISYLSRSRAVSSILLCWITIYWKIYCLSQGRPARSIFFYVWSPFIQSYGMFASSWIINNIF